jgi:hypothetical protein
MQTLVNLLNKTFRAYKIYPPGHEIPKYFLRQLWEVIRETLKNSAEIVLIMDQSKCLDDSGKELWSGEENEDNVAWVLYKNGIRGISITTNVTLLDLQNFFESIQHTITSKDKYSLLYNLSQNEFSGMSFEFIPDFLQDQNILIPETYQEFVKLKEREPKAEPVEVEGQIEASIEIPIIIESREVFTVTSEEERMLNEETEKERQTPHLDNFLKYLFTIIGKGSVKEALCFLKAVEELILFEINNSEVGKAARILQNLKFFKYNLEDREKVNLVDNLIREFSDLSLLETIVKTFVESKPKELENFLINLDPEATLNLFKIAVDLPTKPSRQVLFRAIIGIKPEGHEDIINYVNKNRNNEKILLAGLEFIAMAKVREARDLLLELKLKDDSVIKKSLLEAIAAIEGDLTPFFYDPNIEMRMTTYLEMKKNPRKSFANLVVERLKSPELFYKMDALEKKQFLSIIPEYLDYHAVENALKEIMNQNLSLIDRLSKSKKYYETMQFLINSLVESKNRKVYLLLIETVKATKDNKLREMCSEALKQFKEL